MSLGFLFVFSSMDVNQNMYFREKGVGPNISLFFYN